MQWFIEGMAPGHFVKKAAPQLGTINGPSHASQRSTQGGTQRSGVKYSVVQIRFVRCESQTEEEKGLLNHAVALCQKHKATDTTWVDEKELEALTQENQRDSYAVYIIAPFRGAAFNILKASPSKVYSPECLIACLERDVILPVYLGHPIASRALEHAEVCCSKMEGRDRELICTKVFEMGGLAENNLSHNATHLVTISVGTPKYFAAVKNGIKIVSPSWIDAVYRRKSTGEVYTHDVELARRFRVPIFSGCVVCFSQFTFEQRKEMEVLVKTNGGKPVSALIKGDTTHLVCIEPKGDKFVAAVKWGLPVVTASWIQDCLAAGHSLELDSYLVKEDRVPCPTTPDHVKQGPNGDLATSTPRKGAKQLDHALDISAIPHMPQLPAEVPPPLPNPINSEQKHEIGDLTESGAYHLPMEPMAINGPDFNLLLWEPNYDEPKQRKETKERTVVDTVPKPSTSSAENEPGDVGAAGPSRENKNSESVVIVDNKPKVDFAKPCPVPSYGSRILALKPAGKSSVTAAAPIAPPILPNPLDGSATSSSAPLDTLKAGQRRPGPAASTRSETAAAKGKQPLDSLRQGQLVWSQRERNPFHVAAMEEENGEDIDIQQEISRQSERPGSKVGRPKSTKFVKDTSVEIPVVSRNNGAGAAARTKTPDVLAMVKPPSPMKKLVEGKRNRSIVVLDDDDPVDGGRKKAPAVPAAVPVVVQKALLLIKVPEKVAPPKKPPVFQISSVTSDVEKKRLFQSIRQLGGREIDSTNYSPEVTHLIVKQPIRNEKFLACCAAGKWILHPTYVEDSAAAGHFLPETMYEWGNYEHAESLMASLNLNETELRLSRTAFRWRKKVWETKQPAFFGWKILVAADPTRAEGYCRLLLAGGAQIVSDKPPYLAFAGQATHLFHDQAKISIPELELQQLIAAGVQHHKPDHLAHFLTDGDVSVPTTANQAPSSNTRSAKRAKR